mmetsp:Transcript_21170/g.43052  ORF Transcript_21170/g.43052 Transcript_21170/m.43052 type:complete len:216 (+) Transcript_21170:197-844(+)
MDIVRYTHPSIRAVPIHSTSQDIPLSSQLISSFPFHSIPRLLQIHHLPRSRSRHHPLPPIPGPHVSAPDIRHPIHRSKDQIVRRVLQPRFLSIVIPKRLGQQPMHPHRDPLPRHRSELPRSPRGQEPFGIVPREFGPHVRDLIGESGPRRRRRRGRTQFLRRRGEFVERGFGGVVHVVGQIGGDAQFVESRPEGVEGGGLKGGDLDVVDVGEFGM